MSAHQRAHVAVAILIGWAAFAVHVGADDGVISFTCEGTTCLECLNNGCGWFPSGGEASFLGECVSTCSIIADAPCYSEEFFTGQSPQEICNIVTTDENDWLICSAVTDCAQCTGTAKSDGTSKCVWYELSNNCGTGQCNFLGCGTSTCVKESDVVVDNPATAPTVLRATEGPTQQPIVRIDIENPTLLPLSPTSLDINSPTLGPAPLVDIETSVCDRLSNADCNTCIGSGCGWVNDEICVASCRTIADTACYDNTTFPGVSDVADICNMTQQVESNPTLSPATSTVGCGTAASTCDTCVSAGCGWVNGNTCIRSCSIIADVSCFDSTSFLNVTNVTEICTLAESSQSDAALCSKQTSCTDCLSIQLAAPDSQCSWYEAQDGSSFPSTCCIGCDVPGIRTTTCSSNDLDPNLGPSHSPSPSTTSAPSISPSPSVTQSPSLTSSPSVTQAPTVCEMSTCDACLNAGCAYLGEQNCITSCSIIADISCYDKSTFPNVTNITEICSRAEQTENDATVCSNQSTCTECVSASLSVPDQSCTWYAVSGNQTSKSRCCLSCDVPGTPVTTCEGIANALDTKTSAAESRNFLYRISSLLINVVIISVTSALIC